MLKVHEADVVVIGGGLAGLTACLVAQDAGARTVLLHKGEGATALSSGLVDLLGYLTIDGVSQMVTSPLRDIQVLARDQEEHPYALLGGGSTVAPDERSATARDIVASAIALFRKATETAGLHYTGDGDHNMLIPTPFGTFKPTALVPDTMSKGDLAGLAGGHLFVTGIRGYAGLNPVLVSGSLEYLASEALGGGDKYLRASGKWISLGDKAWTLPQLATYLDTETGYKALETALSAARRDDAFYTHLALPCAGQERAAENLERLEAQLQMTAFEIPSLPPSLGGQRLVRALEKEAAARGVYILPGQEVFAADLSGIRCHSVRARSMFAGSETTYRGKSFVLCTGHIIGGGLISEQYSIGEPIFDLVLSVPSEAHLGKRLTWTQDEPFPQTGHPVTACGVTTAEGLRGVAREQGPIENLFVAGALVAGAQWTAEKDGLGIALSTGFVAGHNAAHLAAGLLDRSSTNRTKPENEALPVNSDTGRASSR